MRRSLGFSLLVVLLLGAGAYLLAAARQPPRGPAVYTVTMTDYAFAPARMVWQPGQQVTLRFVNDSEARPGKTHEWMIGRGPAKEETVFGLQQGDGFEVSFLEGPLEIVQADKVSMLMVSGLELRGEGLAQLEPVVMDMGASTLQEQGGDGMDMSTDAPAPADTPMDMPAPADGGQDDQEMNGAEGMDMGDPGMDTGDQGDMAGMNGQMGAGGGAMVMDAMEMYVSQDLAGAVEPKMEEMSGNFMVVVQPGGSFTMTFTVPDNPGVWSYGCFQQTGEHFLNGMRGTVEVLEGGAG